MEIEIPPGTSGGWGRPPRQLSKSLLASPEDFWHTKLTSPHSTFGAGTKDSFRPLPRRERDESITKAKGWQCKDQHGNVNARVRIESVFGKIDDVPGVGEYNPNHTVISRRENTHDVTIANNHAKTHEDAKFYAEVGLEKVGDFMPVIKKKKARKGPFEPAPERPNVEDWRKSLLPGPGSYDIAHALDKVVRKDRHKMPVLLKRAPIGKPRDVLNEQLDVIDRRTKVLYGGDYDVQEDPRKINKAVTIGEVRPLLGMKEILPIGPGDYNTAHVSAFGKNSILSSSFPFREKR